MTGDRHSTRAGLALARLAETDPALGVLSLWCRHRDGDDARAAWSDPATIHYGPAFERLSLPEQVGVAAHHVLHVALRHVSRAEAMRVRAGSDFDATLFNLAADALVNEMLAVAGYILPRPFVTVTAVLDRLPGAEDPDRNVLSRFDVERLYFHLKTADPRSPDGNKTRAVGPPDGAPVPEAVDRYLAGQGFAPDLGRGDGMRSAQEDDTEWQQRLVRAIEAGRTAGRGVGMVGRDLAELRIGRTPWEAVLRGLIAKAVIPRPRPGFARPSNRWLARDSDATASGLAAPAFEAAQQRLRAVPRIAVGIDVSGSIDDRRLAQFAGQIAGIGQRSGAEVHVLVFDDGVRSHHRMTGLDWAGEVARIKMTGGGGTSYAELFAQARSLRASALVVLTDLDGAFGTDRPPFPVIWAVPDAMRAPKPGFGRVLDLAD